MKVILQFVIYSLLALLLSACSDSDASADSLPSPYAKATATEGNSPIVARKAYDRGFAKGREIASMAVDSREREQAIIDVHGMVSALERNGYRQSALDFSRGVEAGLK